MKDPFEHISEAIRNSAEVNLYRARQHGNRSPVLVLPQSPRRLEHEDSLAAELEPAWAAKPLALTRHEGRTILIIADRVFILSGRIQKENIAEREALIGAEGADPRIILDLKDMTLTGLDGINFLAQRETADIARIAIHTYVSGSRDKKMERSPRWFSSEENAEQNLAFTKE